MSALIPEQASNSPENRIETRMAQSRVWVDREQVSLTVEGPKNSQDLKYDGLITITPGFCGYEDSMAGLRRRFAQEGYMAATYNPKRKPISIWDSIHNAQSIHVAAQEAVANEVRYLFPDQEEFNVDKKLLVAHSMGGLATAPFAVKNSLMVDKVINIAALGYSKFNLAALMQYYPNILHNSSQELARAYQQDDIDLSPRDLLHIFKYCFKPQSVFEIISCFKELVHNEVAHIRAEGKPVAYIALENDIVVRPDERIARHVDHYEVMEGAGHLAPATKPQRVAAQVLQVVQKLDADPLRLAA